MPMPTKLAHYPHARPLLLSTKIGYYPGVGSGSGRQRDAEFCTTVAIRPPGTTSIFPPAGSPKSLTQGRYNFSSLT
jgi:hypothetical protein